MTRLSRLHVVERMLIRSYKLRTHAGTCKGLISTGTEVLGQRKMSQKTKESNKGSGESFLMFLYGTLKHGQPNHPYLVDTKTGRAQLVGKGHTQEKYPLVIAGKYNIPYLLFHPGDGHQVCGEVYRVDLQKRDYLDDFESHPTYYERTEEDIIIPEEKGEARTLKCWVYFMKNYKDEMLGSTRYASYDSLGPHGQRYVERYKRTCSGFEDLQQTPMGKNQE